MKRVLLNKCFLGVLCTLLAIIMVIAYMPVLAAARGDGSSEAVPYTQGELVDMENQVVPLTGGVRIMTPSADGTATLSNASAVVDYSNAPEGYVMIKYTGGGSSKIKVQIAKTGGKTYTYDLKSDGAYETFPLSSGDGQYTVGVFKNVRGTAYAQVLDGSINVKLTSSLNPFLYPNQYVDFTAESKTVKKSEELAEGTASDLEIIENIYNYVVTNIKYDEHKAATVKPGYIPVSDNTLATGKGICFDYAVLMTAMLRAQRIPTRLEIGYVSGGAYHAWISTYIKDVGWVNDVIQFDGKTWRMMDPTFASSGDQSAAIMKYIGNGSNYSMQYCY